MIVTREEALAFIYEALTDINTERGGSSLVPLVPETRLIGSDRDLDSLEIVNLIVGLEERLAAHLSRPVVLVNEAAFGGGQAFRSVDSLADHVVRLSQA